MARVGLRYPRSHLIDVGANVFAAYYSVQAVGNYETGKYTGTEPGIINKSL